MKYIYIYIMTKKLTTTTGVDCFIENILICVMYTLIHISKSLPYLF